MSYFLELFLLVFICNSGLKIRSDLNGFIAFAVFWTLTAFIIMIKWDLVLDSVALI